MQHVLDRVPRIVQPIVWHTRARRMVAALCAAVAVACGASAGQPDASSDAHTVESAFVFVDVSASSPDLGLAPFGGAPGWDHSDKYTPGVALVDLDGDGILDLVQPRNDRVDPSLRPVRMYRGRGDGRFEDATTVVWDDTRNATCVLAFDYDADDDLDVFIGVDRGANVLYRNDGDWQFTDVAASAGVTLAAWRSYAAAAGDVDGDGDLDIYVGTFNADAPNHGPGTAPNRLLVNRGDGTFVDVTDDAGVACEGRSTLGVALADLDADGDLDIYAANDFFADCLYRNDGGGRFVDVAPQAGILDAASRGMGVAVGDLDADGALDIVVTDTENLDDSLGNAVFFNRGDLRFSSLAREVGLDGLVTLGADWLVSWGVGLVDLDLDGDVDVHVVTHGERRELMWRNDRNAFTPLYDVINGWDDIDGRGSAYGDIDGDGDLDIVVGRRGAGLQVLRNDTVGGAGIAVDIRPLHLAPGAVVTALVDGRYVATTVFAGQGYMSSSPPMATLGLGAASSVDVIRVRLLDGRVLEYTDIIAGTRLTARFD